MLLLAADTSGKHGSIALARCAPGGLCDIIEVVPLGGGTFSAQLVPQIAALLAKHGLGKRDIDGLAIVSGPGSFTGLRVGLAAIKGLAEVLKKPVAAVSLLEAIAAVSGLQGGVMAGLDAGRGEVYTGEYRVNRSDVRLVHEKLLTRAEFIEAARDHLVAVSDTGLADEARQTGKQVVEIDLPRADSVARLGWWKLQAGKAISPGDLDANYIRRSDAEIFAKSNV